MAEARRTTIKVVATATRTNVMVLLNAVTVKNNGSPKRSCTLGIAAAVKMECYTIDSPIAFQPHLTCILLHLISVYIYSL